MRKTVKQIRKLHVFGHFRKSQWGKFAPNNLNPHLENIDSEFYAIFTWKQWLFKKYFLVQSKQACCAGADFLDEAPPVGKIQPFIKIAVTFEPTQRFRCPSRFKISVKMSIQFVLWLEAWLVTVWAWRRRKYIWTKVWINQSINQSQRCL